MNIINNGFSAVRSCVETVISLLPGVVRCTAQTARQDSRVIMIEAGVYAIFTGMTVLGAGSIAKTLSSWIWRRNSPSDDESRGSGVAGWVVTAGGVAVTCMGVCAVASGVFLLYHPPSQLNYLESPGHHSIFSPITGSRSHERNRIRDKWDHLPVLTGLEHAIYYDDKTFFHRFSMIDPNNCSGAAKIADQMFSNYLDNYREFGVNETNVVHWKDFVGYSRDDIDSGTSCSGASFISIGLFSERPVPAQSVLEVVICKGELTGSAFCFPDSLVAMHELRHAEELGLDRESHFDENGKELLTTMSDLIRVDEIVKKMDNVPLETEMNYRGKEYSILPAFGGGKECRIPVGKLINFYRGLSEGSNLAEALVSQESMDFLTCVNQPPTENIPKTTRKYFFW